ncbi:MAG TPA: tetratricopeptide repeat protein [Candidatus Acidoferrales bacterium]|nr:tetratricopeptide repeat protein [Candidatus Acidoferrales bacterium]
MFDRKKLVYVVSVAFLWPVTLSARQAPAPPAASSPQPAPGESAPPAAAQNAPAPPQSEVDRRGEAYYQFTIGRMYEEQYEFSGRPEYAGRAITAYKRAYELDSHSAVIGERLAEAYARAGRIPEAIAEAEGVLKQDPANLPARRILARIYVRSLGDVDSAEPQKEVVNQAIEQYREIVRLDPTDLESALWLARLYRLAQQDDKAEPVLRALLKATPDDERALRQLALLLLDADRPTEAVALLEPVAKKATTPEWSTMLGEAYSKMHDYPSSEAACRTAVKLQGDNGPARKCLGEALLLEEKYDGALEQYLRLTEIEPNDPQHFLRLALIYRRLGQLDKAEQSLLRAKQDAPGSLEVIYNEALTYRAQGRFDDAIRVLSDAVAAARGTERASTMAILYEQLGALFREVENYPAALETFEELRSLGPDQEKRATELIIDTYRMNRQLAKALEESQKAIAAYPDDRSFVMTRALLLSEKGDTPGGAALIQGLLKESPKDFELYMTLAQVYERGHKFHEAEQAALDAEKLAGRQGNKVMVWFLRGAIAERQKKFDEAEEQFKRVLAAEPHESSTLNYYGYMLADRGVRLDEAVALIQRALAEEPYNGAFLDSMGWACFKQGKLEQARTNLEKAVARDQHDPTVREHLGEVYYKMGRPTQALAEWTKAQAFWKEVTPADYESEQVAGLDKKVSQLKHEMAQTGAPSAKP